MEITARLLVALAICILAIGVTLPTASAAPSHHSKDNLHLTFERFCSIAGVSAKALEDSDYAHHVNERFGAAKARLEKTCSEIGPNATFDVDFMPFDMWTDEEREMLNGGVIQEDSYIPARGSDATYEYNYVDYRDKGFVSRVKNQGQCGSCYAFAAVGCLESQYLKNELDSQDSIDLSEHQGVGCTFHAYSPYNFGCNGGDPPKVIDYFTKKEALTGDEEPYKPMRLKAHPSGQCTPTPDQSLTINYVSVVPESEDHLAYILEHNGPVIICLHGSSAGFQGYRSGIFHEPTCSVQNVNHAVLLVGSGVDKDGTEFWVVKNSWGDTWGESGFIRMRKGSNECNIMTYGITIVSINGDPIY